jgi:predicted dehydrogenase
MKKYTIGIIGYGGFGKFLHHWWSRLEHVNVTAVYGGTVDRSVYENVKEYERWEDLLSDDAIDIISIATPPALHVEMACAAMRHRKHVLLEKPAALHREGAEKLVQTQKETGMVITVDHMLRYNPIVKALIQLSKDETFGKLRHVVVSNYAQDESLPAEHWFWDKTLSGGIFIEHGVHFFDIVNALSDQKAVAVQGSAHNRNEKQQDQVAALVRYNDGLIASHYHSFSGPGFFEETTIRLRYDLASIEVRGWIPMKGTIKALIKKEDRVKLSKIPGFKSDDVTPISGLTDDSRPEGWGDASSSRGASIMAGGISYGLDEMLTGSFEIVKTKSEVYGVCLQDIISDLIQKIENPQHRLIVTLEDAIDSVKTALLADETAENGLSPQ